MKKALIALAICVGALAGAAPAQAQVPCSPGQTGAPPYCQTPPPGCDRFTSKISLRRATFDRRRSTIDIFALITHRASGRVSISLQAARRFTTFTAPIDSARGRIRITRQIPRSQARLGTGIITIRYAGDADTRPQEVRLRAANNPASLTTSRPELTASGFLTAAGSVTRRANGVVRVQLEYVNRADGETVTLERSALINDRGLWSLNASLSPSIRAQIAARCGTVHSYILFTGYRPRRIRGEMFSREVLPAP